MSSRGDRLPRTPVFGIVLLAAAACSSVQDTECLTNEECNACEVCENGSCVTLPACSIPPQPDAAISDASPQPEPDATEAADALESSADATNDAASPEDAAEPDAGVESADAGAADAAPPDSGYPPPTFGAFRIQNLAHRSCTQLLGVEGRSLSLSDTHLDLTTRHQTIAMPLDNLSSGSLQRYTGSDNVELLVQDLSTGVSYLLGDGFSPFDGSPIVAPSFPQTRTVRRLYAIEPDTVALDGTQIALSQDIAVTSSTGYFSGFGSFAIHTGERLYDVDISSGMVTDLGPFAAPPAKICRGGYWGVEELFDGSIQLAFVDDTSTTATTAPATIIDRLRVADGSVSQVMSTTTSFAFCGFAISTQLGRWASGTAIYPVFADAPWKNATEVCDLDFDTPGNARQPRFTPSGETFSVFGPNTTISGTAEPGSTVELFDGHFCAGTSIAAGTAGAGGDFSFSVPTAVGSIHDCSAHALRSDGTRSLCTRGRRHTRDELEPTFGGATLALFHGSTVVLGWEEANDDLAPPSEIAYEACHSTVSGGCSTFRADYSFGRGVTRGSIPGLAIGVTHYFLVRARDPAGNYDFNTVEVSVTPQITGSDFRISTLSASGCRAVGQVLLTTRPNGAVVAGSDRVFSTGDLATTHFAIRDLSGGRALWMDAIDPEPGIIASDLATGRVFVFSSSIAYSRMVTFPFPTNAQATRLIPLDPLSGAATTPELILSSAVTLEIGGGIFSGMGKIAIVGASSISEIDLSTGAVSTIFSGANTIHDLEECGDSLTYGILENVAGTRSLVYPTRSNRIDRYELTTNSTSIVATFSRLDGACSISFSLPWSRWYLMESGRGILGAGQALVGYCDGSFTR